MLDASLWPDSVTVSKWYFKQPTTEANDGDKRRRVEVVSAAEQQSANNNNTSICKAHNVSIRAESEAQPSDHEITMHRDSGNAQNDTLFDETVLVVNDSSIGVNMDVETPAVRNDGE